MTIAGRANSPRLIVIETGLRQHVEKSRAFVEQIIWDRGMSVPPSACVPHLALGGALPAEKAVMKIGARQLADSFLGSSPALGGDSWEPQASVTCRACGEAVLGMATL